MSGSSNFSSLPKCGAKAKTTGKPCQHPARKSTGRCRLHSGRPPTHGRHTKKAKEERKRVRQQISEARNFLKDIKEITSV